MNQLAYKLLRSGKTDDAIILFEMNTTSYANSSNAWDSLREAYRKKKDRENTIRCYETALRIDPVYPNSGFARTLLSKIR